MKVYCLYIVYNTVIIAPGKDASLQAALAAGTEAGVAVLVPPTSAKRY